MTTNDDAARAEAERLYSDKMHAYHAYLRGHRDARAQIAARRDEVAEALYERWGDDHGVRLYEDPRTVADAALAALGVSDR